MFQSTAIIGADGMLGTDLRAALERSGEFGRLSCTQFPETDIAQPDSVQGFLDKARPEIIFNCAAYTDVDGCESRRDLAFAVNASGAGNVAAAAARTDALLVQISTDYVFDGAKGAAYVEEDAPNPLSVYGRSKLEGERQVMERGRKWLIVRTGWLYGSHRTNIVDRVLRKCRDGEELTGACDLVGSPTWSAELADALIVLAEAHSTGIFHVVNRGACSRLEQIRAIVAGAGLSRTVRSTSSQAFPRPARIPPYSALSVEKFERETGHPMRSWREALLEYVRRHSPERFASGPA